MMISCVTPPSSGECGVIQGMSRQHSPFCGGGNSVLEKDFSGAGQVSYD